MSVELSGDEGWGDECRRRILRSRILGGVTVALQAPVVTGDFQIAANTCGATLAAGVGCTVSVVFAPTASGSAEWQLQHDG